MPAGHDAILSHYQCWIELITSATDTIRTYSQCHAKTGRRQNSHPCQDFMLLWANNTNYPITHAITLRKRFINLWLLVCKSKTSLCALYFHQEATKCKRSPKNILCSLGQDLKRPSHMACNCNKLNKMADTEPSCCWLLKVVHVFSLETLHRPTHAEDSDDT